MDIAFGSDSERHMGRRADIIHNQHHNNITVNFNLIPNW